MKAEYPNLELMEYIFKQTLASDDEWKMSPSNLKTEKEQLIQAIP